MKKQEIISLLNKNHNFHLTFKVICFESALLLDKYDSYLNKNNIKHIVIKDIENSYDLLKQAYDNNIKNVICISNIDFLLYQVVVLDNDNVSVIKPIIPVYYLSKDNKIIQKIKTRCHQLDNKFFGFKDKETLFIEIDKKIA